jgi:hypothetical protein
MSFHDIHVLQPSQAEGKLLLNDLSYLTDRNFLPVYISEKKIGWISKDSTTLDAQRSIRMCLDSPPMNSMQNLGTIYDKNSNITRYRGIYHSRNDLPGQIQYHFDPQMTHPFFTPLFPEDVKTMAAVYIDPMNNISYDFRRVQDQPLNCSDCTIPEFRDSQHFREDMLANIMRTRLKNEFEPVYYNFTSRYRSSR